jgi:hypothetical protein
LQAENLFKLSNKQAKRSITHLLDISSFGECIDSVILLIVQIFLDLINLKLLATLIATIEWIFENENTNPNKPIKWKCCRGQAIIDYKVYRGTPEC